MEFSLFFSIELKNSASWLFNVGEVRSIPAIYCKIWIVSDRIVFALSYLQSKIGSNSSKFVWRSIASSTFKDSSLMHLKKDHEPKCKHAQCNGKDIVTNINNVVCWPYNQCSVSICNLLPFRHSLFASDFDLYVVCIPIY